MAFLDKTGLNYFWEAIKSHLSTNYQGKHITQTATLASGSWNSSKQQTVAVSGVTSSNTVIISAAPESHIEFCTAQARGISQASDSLTFQCETVPTSDLTVNITILT